MTDKTGLQEPDRVVFFFIPEYHLLFSQDLKKKKKETTLPLAKGRAVLYSLHYSQAKFYTSQGRRHKTSPR